MPKSESAAGKPEQGTVILNSYQDGENIFVEIKDDGKGLDPEKLRNKAIQKAFIQKSKSLKCLTTKFLR